ncbi:MAG: phosphoglucosamine mutase [Alphaproteobacteria bacterium]|nr:phosphoglucosamine mutase [Alphaproteobacteria bacterium]
MSEKLFGTDGIRGIANQYPLTANFCFKLAVILSHLFCTKQHKIAIARDPRISKDMLFCSLCAGFTAKGIDVLDLGIIPTPLCTTLIPTLNVDMGIMITASHNHYHDNGLKLIAANGDKFSDSQTTILEEKMSAYEYESDYDENKIGKIIPVEAGLKNYLQTIQKLASSEALSNMNIVVDSANGAMSAILPKVFKSLGANIISLADTPDGYNINQDCGSQHTEILCKTVIENHYDLGIAVDGDGDRIIICDENGNRLDGDQIIAYLSSYFKRHNLLKGNTVVATIYSNLGLGKYIRSLGIDYQTSAVGERYVIEKMRQTGSNLGGEESGHMVLSDYSHTGDALLTAIVVCLGIKESGKKVSEIFPVFTPFPSCSKNLRFADKTIISHILENEEIQNCIAEIKKQLEGHGVVLVRKSGTEPVIRLKIEDENADLVQHNIEKLLNCINKYSI